MLHLTGKCLGVQSEQKMGSTGPFTSTTIHVLAGYDTYAVQAGRDLKPEDLPKQDEEVTLIVEVGHFKFRDGSVGLRFTATGRVASGQRAARPVAVNG